VAAVSRAGPAVARVLRVIQACASDPALRLVDVAAGVGVSEAWLSRHLKRATGASFPAHLNRARVEHAKLLLRSTAFSVKQIAAQAGYLRPSDLDRHFRAIVGRTPLSYRRQRRRRRMTEAT
jgi:AraC family transcriptional regulator